MSGDSPWNRLRENATGVVSMLVTGIWLAAMFTGQDWWLAALLFGYIVVVPLTAILFGDDDDMEEWWDDSFGTATESADATSDSTDAGTPLERLRRRYADGELTDEQFERKVERLLETETLEDVEDNAQVREREVERN